MRFSPLLAGALVSALFAAPTLVAHADAPPPSQELSGDPAPPSPRIGLSTDGIGIALGDFALRIDWAPDTFHAFSLTLGESRRQGGDAILALVGWTLFPMSMGLQGFFVGTQLGLGWAGPWNGDDPNARTLGRLEGEVGWQFLWTDISITLAAGATGLWYPEEGDVWVEPHGRVSLGVVFR